MERRRPERIQSLNDIANSINKMTNDDEILTKITLNFISALKTAIEKNEPLNKFYDPSTIAINFWPYGSPPKVDIDSTPENIESDKSSAQDTIDIRPKRSMNQNSLQILHRMQQEMGKKLTQFDLIRISKHISEKLRIPLKKRERQSKIRVLDWIQANLDLIEPSLTEILHEYQNLTSDADE